MRDRDMRNKFKAIDDLIAVPGQVKDTMAVVGADKLDPLNLRFNNVVFNPIYHIRIAITNWQHARDEQAKAEAEAIELHLMYLKEQREGKGLNGKLRKQIEYYEGRLNKLRKRLSDLENEAREDN